MVYLLIAGILIMFKLQLNEENNKIENSLPIEYWEHLGVWDNKLLQFSDEEIVRIMKNRNNIPVKEYLEKFAMNK